MLFTLAKITGEPKKGANCPFPTGDFVFKNQVTGFLVLSPRFELGTSSLPMRCSTTELRQPVFELLENETLLPQGMVSGKGLAQGFMRVLHVLAWFAL